jgi:hypothetical protein
MKRITLALLLLFCITTFAQQGINYKAVIKDGAGAILSGEDVDVTFIILDGVTNVYEETHASTTDANGIVILNIGEGTPVSGDFSALDWSSTNHELNVQIDTGGGLQDMGDTPFKTVPYAMHSTTATTATTATELTGGIDQAYIAALEARIAALEPQPAVIGDIREGGVVFWVDSTGLHGLVCAFSDYVSDREWGCDGLDLPNVPNVGGVTNPSGLGAEIGDGINNTNNILNDCPSAPAALAARSLGTEWFLPSAKELNEMYVNKTTLEAVAGFSAFDVLNYYWSSTEFGVNSAWGQLFWFGNQDFINKSSASHVRAVRAF